MDWEPMYASRSLDINALEGMQAPLASCDEVQKKKSVNLSRERMKSELRSLRAEAVRLEDTLSILRLRREHDISSHADKTGRLTSTAPVWAQVAARQIMATKKLTTQKAKLRRHLRSQQTMAEYLGVLVSEARDVCDSHQASLPHILRCPEQQAAVREPSEDELKMLLESAEEAFAHYPRFSDGVSIRFFDSRLVVDDVSTVVVDLYASWVLPFDRVDVETAVRTHMHVDPHGSGLDLVAKTQHKIDLCAQPKTHCDRGTDGSLLMVCTTRMEPTCKCRLVSCVGLCEDAWLRVVDTESLGISYLDSTVVVVQQVCRLRLRFERHLRSDNRDLVVKELTALMEMRMRRALQRVENALISRSSLKSTQS